MEMPLVPVLAAMEVEGIKLDSAAMEIFSEELQTDLVRLTEKIHTLSDSGPGGATEDKPVGTVCIGLADADSVNGYRFNFTFDNRWMNKRVFATAALDLLRRQLLGIPR